MPWLNSPRPAERRPGALALVLALVSLLYPLLIYFGMQRFEPRWLALLLLAVALLRAISTRQPIWWIAAALAAGLAVLAGWGNQLLPLKLYPPLLSGLLLLLFAASLRYPPSVIERLARLQEPDLPEHAVSYTRRVTQVWCGFFIVNGSISLLTALYASEALWALYNGLLSYVLMGLLFAGEYWVRRRVRAAHG